MKRVLVTALISLVTLAVAAPAPAAGPTLNSLARQVKALQKEVKTLKKRVAVAESVILFVGYYSACSTAVTADAIQGTWTRIDGHFATPIFGPQTAVSDARTCERIRITRAAPSQQPPNAAVFNSLLALFQPRG